MKKPPIDHAKATIEPRPPRAARSVSAHCLGGLLICSISVRAQVLPGSVLACRAEPDDRLRLQCYDRELGKFGQSPSPPGTGAAGFGAATAPGGNAISGAAPQAAGATTEAGLRSSTQVAAANGARPISDPAPATGPTLPTAGIAARSASASAAADAQPPVEGTPPPRAVPAHLPMFKAKITALRFRRSGEFVATLDNGQVWTQYVTEGKARIGVGDTVIIRPGWLGSYVLVGPSDWITKVHPLEDAGPDR